jgi:hypothetical protein
MDIQFSPMEEQYMERGEASRWGEEKMEIGKSGAIEARSRVGGRPRKGGSTNRRKARAREKTDLKVGHYKGKATASPPKG